MPLEPGCLSVQARVDLREALSNVLPQSGDFPLQAFLEIDNQSF
jgi:hypothetical protein